MKRPSGFDPGSDPEPRRRQPSRAASDRATTDRAEGGSAADPPQTRGRAFQSWWRAGRADAPADDDSFETAPIDAETPDVWAPDAQASDTAVLATADLGRAPLAADREVVPAAPDETPGSDPVPGALRVAAGDRTPAGLARRLFGGADDADPLRVAERRLKEAERARRKGEQRERRRFREFSRARRRNWLIAGGAVVGLALFVAVGTLTPIMAVREVQIVGASRVNTDEVRTALARFDGVPLALVNDTEVHRALEPFPLIQRYALERIPPSTLLVRIQERTPVVAIERDGAVALYDPAGVLVETVEARPDGAPLASGAVADPTSEAFRAAAKAIRDMPEGLRAQLATVTGSSAHDVQLGLTSGVEVFWGEAAETARKSVVLTTLLSSLGDRPLSMVDVSSPDAPVFR